jgi:hypothetical protein
VFVLSLKRPYYPKNKFLQQKIIKVGILYNFNGNKATLKDGADLFIVEEKIRNIKEEP